MNLLFLIRVWWNSFWHAKLYSCPVCDDVLEFHNDSSGYSMPRFWCPNCHYSGGYRFSEEELNNRIMG